MTRPVFTSETGNNDLLIQSVANLYLRPGFKIADVTFGKGVFWKKLDMSQYDFHNSDLKTVPERPYDFTKLPYGDAEFDVVVLDPPYVHNPGALIVNPNYQNAETTKGMYHKDIVELYKKGMMEAYRTLKVGGTLWVKCKDEVESSYQRWSHVELYDIALELGFFGKDLFILTQNSKPILQHPIQQHARKNHSYLWIFKKPSESEKKYLLKHKIWQLPE